MKSFIINLSCVFLLSCGVTDLSSQSSQVATKTSSFESEDSTLRIEQDLSSRQKGRDVEKNSSKRKKTETKNKSIEIENEKNDTIEENQQTEVAVEEEMVEDPIISSNGEGGLTGMNEVSFDSSNNLSSTYKINAPEDVSQKVYGLHIHLHGDGGGGYTDFPNVETRYNLIGVTVRSPNQGTSWNRDGQNFALYVDELIQNELLKKYNIDLDRIYFSTVSGGSYFMTGAFIPLYGAKYKTGGAFMMCGGRAPQFDFSSPDGESFLKTYRLHWESTNEVGRADIRSSVEASVAAYQQALGALGAVENPQTNQIKDDFGHCEFDGQNYTSGIQLAIDESFKIILPEEN
ncbi:MAG: hypothetical protein AB8C84_05770 [Oligoflexales bacterium]